MSFENQNISDEKLGIKKSRLSDDPYEHEDLINNSGPLIELRK